jgi:hypothetical protein
LGYFTFNNSTCTWDNDGTAQPAAPEKAVGILLLSTILGTWIMMEQLNLQTRKSKLLGPLLLSTILPVLGIMMEPHNHQQKKKTVGILLLSTTSTCTWDNDGTTYLQHQKK